MKADYHRFFERDTRRRPAASGFVPSVAKNQRNRVDVRALVSAGGAGQRLRGRRPQA